MIECLVVGAGGFVGAVLRYLVGLLEMNPESGFPLKTFIINIAGAFLIGVVAALASREALSPKTVLFLKVGICGGFTTFSSFALENHDLMMGGSSGVAVTYMAVSLVLGILAVYVAQRMFGA